VSSDYHAEHIVADIETGVISGAGEYVETITEAPKNYKDPDKIAEYLAKANSEQLTKAALDVDLCRVVAIGFWLNDGKGIRAATADSEQAEAMMLTAFWTAMRGPFGLRTIVGHNILDFDLPALQRRSLYLGIQTPRISLDRYRHPNVVDTMQELSYNGKLRYRSLNFFCKRFGIQVDDPVVGSEIPALIAMKDWDAIKGHVRADVEKAKALAERIGIIDLPPAPLPTSGQFTEVDNVPF
jgi:hypothetical protein